MRHAIIPEQFAGAAAPLTHSYTRDRDPVQPPSRRKTPAVLLPATTFILLSIGMVCFCQEPPNPTLDEKIASGVQALKAGDLETAEQFLREALRRGAKSALVYHNLGVIAQERRSQSQAINYFRKALLNQPDYGPSRLLLGSSLLALGRREEAIRELKRAVTLMPDEPMARRELARAHEATGNWLEAVQQWQKLAGSDPQNAEYSYQLARALTRLSGWSLQEIGRIDPNSARLQQALGQEYAIQQKYDLALEAYRRAAHSDPKLPEVHLGMAVILLRLNRVDEAMEQIRMELSLVPESRVAAETKSKIEAAKAATSP